jgi:hypothetical protein
MGLGDSGDRTSAAERSLGERVGSSPRFVSHHLLTACVAMMLGVELIMMALATSVFRADDDYKYRLEL